MKKTLMIIGAGPGIGMSTARQFAKNGFRVVLASRNKARIGAMIDELHAENPEYDIVSDSVDAYDLQQIDELIHRYDGSLDVLFYNAGVLRYDSEGALQMSPLTNQNLAMIESDIRINITGALAAIRAAVPSMKDRRTGTILLTGGGLALHPMADLLTLSVGKAGIRNMTQGLFESLKESNIHIASVTVAALVSPGSVAANEIANEFWNLYSEQSADWRWEATYSAAN